LWWPMTDQEQVLYRTALGRIFPNDRHGQEVEQETRERSKQMMMRRRNVYMRGMQRRRHMNLRRRKLCVCVFDSMSVYEDESYSSRSCVSRKKKNRNHIHVLFNGIYRPPRLSNHHPSRLKIHEHINLNIFI
jgi:hypothetical protein